MLMFIAVIAGTASAQSLPGTDALPSGGAGVTTGPDGLNVGLDGGETGGVNLGVGPGGPKIGLRGPTPPAITPPATSPPAGGEPGERASSPGGSTQAPSSSPSAPSAPGAVTAQPRSGSDGRGRRDGRGRGGGSVPRTADGRGGDDSAANAAIDRLRPTAAANRDGKGGVAPVFDLIERIPAVVRAGLVALALIAIALWGLWVRGRRRLDQNAYVDPDTGVANMEAFEQMLEREWQRAVRYRRPLGLLLLDVEQNGAGGIRLLGERDARATVDDISKEVRGSDTVARLAQSRFAVICPEAPQGSVETLAHALELKLEERRLRCWAGFAERADGTGRPADLVTSAATVLADAHAAMPETEADPEHETVAFPAAAGRAAAA